MHNALLLGHLPQRLCGIAIGQAAFPYLAAAAVSRDRKLFQQRWLTTITTAAFLATMSALALIGGGRWLIRLIFERGAFDSAAGDLTFAILQLFALGLPIYVIVEITGRALVALGDARTPLLANGVQLLTRIGVATLLWPIVGVLAVPIATVASGIVEVSILCGILWRRLSMVTDWHTIGDPTVSL
jgi:putative peptidoglycan lipid II flippase